MQFHDESDLSDFSSCSSAMAKDVYDIQNQILQQSKHIEKYLLEHSSNQQNSESYSVLQSLFTLFKTEAKMNIHLRHAIVKMKEVITSLNDQISNDHSSLDSFFAELSKYAKQPISDFDGIFEYLVSKPKKEKKQYIRQLAKQEKLIQKLQRQLVDAQHEIQNRDDQLVSVFEENDHLASQSHNLKTKISQDASTIASLKRELSESTSVIDRQREALRTVKVTRSDSENTIQAEKDRLEIQFQALQQQCESQQEKISQLQHIIDMNKESVQSETSTLVNKLEKTTDALHENQIQVTMLLSRNDFLAKENEQLQAVNNDLKAQLDSAMETISQLKESAHARELEFKDQMKEKCQDKCRALHDLKKKQSEKMSKLSHEIEAAVNKRVRDVESRLAEKNEEVERVHSEISQYKTIVAEVEEKKRSARLEAANLRAENERLREVMRNKQADPIVAKIKTVVGLPNSASNQTLLEVISTLRSSRKH